MRRGAEGAGEAGGGGQTGARVSPIITLRGAWGSGEERVWVGRYDTRRAHVVLLLIGTAPSRESAGQRDWGRQRHRLHQRQES